ncbi:MAG TPA: DUF4291 domain-containing protein [Longimicrobium sp.]|nr:DUF4291 domain-containing protein [Longimicrobium sp.]
MRSADEKPGYREIRAAYGPDSIRVYQAYSDGIAEAALRRGTFVSPPFKMERMTWIKPSFLWMMYRAGWGFKDEGQKRILAIDISREGFDWALVHANLSHYDAALPYSEAEWRDRSRATDIVIQWDPERDLALQPLPFRAIQIGLRGEAVRRYVDEWIVGITDVTPLSHDIRRLVQSGDLDAAQRLLPGEAPYPVNPEVAAGILASPGPESAVPSTEG